MFSITLLSVFHTSLSAATISLRPEDSVNGISKTYDLQPDDVYSLAGDVFMSNVDNSALNKAFFNVAAGSVTFLGNQHGLYFNNITSGTTQEGAVLSCQNALTEARFTGFSSLSFIQSPGDIEEQGCLYAKHAIMLLNNHTVRFERNRSKTTGGAINAGHVTILGSDDSVFFYQNEAVSGGGAINSTGPLLITRNQAQMQFLQNIGSLGGALHSTGDINISQNAYIAFKENQALATGVGKGGAIYCLPQSGGGSAPTVTLSEDKQLIFERNSALLGGGAIYAKELRISSGGPTLFQGNTVLTAAGKGGAIAIDDSGTLSISAEGGDIVFEGNTVGAAGSVFHNAIDLGTSAKITTLRAAQGHSIYFYDPITVTGTTSLSDILYINGPDVGDKKEYSGTVVFSAEKLSATETQDPKNRTSTLLQNVVFESGTIILKDGVIFNANSFLQDSRSKLIMDLGTSLVASSGDINLVTVEINADSLTNGKKIKLSATTPQKDIYIDRPIVLAIANESFYQSRFLSESHSYDDILELDAGRNILIASDSRSIDAVHYPYGYQGVWAIHWADDDKKVSISWAKQRYNPNPEQEAPLVPNLLWGSFIDIRSFQKFIEVGTEGAPYEKRFWVAGISNVLHRSRNENQRKFRHVSAGAVVGASTKMPGGDTLSMGFTQLFVHDKDYFINTNFAKTYAGSLRLQHEASLYSVVSVLLGEGGIHKTLLPYVSKTLPFFFYGQLSYGYTDNRMKTEYTALSTVHTSWGGSVWAGELGSRAAIENTSGRGFFQEYAPFIKVQAVYAHHDSFAESGATARGFTETNLYNLAIPIGIKFEKRFNEQYYNALVMYSPDVCRSNPECTTTVLSNLGSWDTKGSNLARQACIAQASGFRSLGSSAELFGNLSFEWRGSSRNYTIDAGSKIKF